MAINISSQPPISSTKTAPTPTAGHCVAANVPGVPRNSNNLGALVHQVAMQHGMITVPGYPGLYYSQQDGSVFGLYNQVIERGYFLNGQITLFQGKPQALGINSNTFLQGLGVTSAPTTPNNPGVVAQSSNNAINVTNVMATGTQFNSNPILYGSLAAARIPFLRTVSTIDLDNAVKQLGVSARKVGQDQYQFSDGSWILINNGRVERGFQDAAGNYQRLMGQPVNALNFPKANPQSQPPNSAIGQLLSGGGRITAAALQNAGFSKTLPNAPIFMHADGSWAVDLGNNQFAAGYGQMQVDAPSFWTVVAPSATGGCQVPVFPSTASPPGGWQAWLQSGVRVAWVPFQRNWAGTPQEMEKVFIYLGYTQGPNQTWQHPEGSSFSVAGGGLNPQSIVWRNMGFQSFPYNSGMSGMMGQIAQAWLEWVRGQRPTPPIEDKASWPSWGL